jgi:hypothetical protein
LTAPADGFWRTGDIIQAVSNLIARLYMPELEGPELLRVVRHIRRLFVICESHSGSACMLDARTL